MIAYRDALKRLIASNRGTTAIEYALIASLILVVIIASISGNGTSIGTLFSNTVTAIGNAIAGDKF